MGTEACRCKPRDVMVTQRCCNHSAFNGYRWTASDYSRVFCLHCGATWRTKGAYVASSPDAPEGWEQFGEPSAWRRQLAEAAKETRSVALQTFMDADAREGE